MNNICCEPIMTGVGVRAAAFGSRGLLLWQRQCRMIMGTKGSPLCFAVRPRLPHLHWPREIKPSQTSLRRPSLLTLQCSVQDPFPPATTYVLLNTREYADGSIMFNFGTSEQQVTEVTSEQSNKIVTNEVSANQAESKDSVNKHVSVNGIGKKISVETTEQDSATNLGESKVDDVPDSASLSDITHGAEELAQELNKKEDMQKVEESTLSSDQIQINVSAESNGASNLSSSTGSEGSDSSGLGMKEEDPNQDFVLKSAAAMIPHPDKAKTGGEDAYFIDGERWVGVADGVGGWALSGVNAGHYSRELMWNCAERARKVGSTSDPKSVLVYAAKRTKAKGTAATLIASLYDKTLRVANIGDSGFVVVRGTTVVAKSEPMVRGFNFPYQIGTDGDDPEMAEVYDFQVKKDDVVILGSDGIFDNLFEGQITAIVSSAQQAGGGPEVVAQELVRLAQKVGATRQGSSPFAVAAHAAGYASYYGGKLDDTTAVVAYVT